MSKARILILAVIVLCVALFFWLDLGRFLSLEELQARQQRLQAAYHPDRHVGASEHEKRLSVQMASWVNQAFETLRDPVKRSRYLLEISGASLPDDSATTADSAFLMEQIELREELDECRRCQDPMRRCAHITGKLDQRSREYAVSFENLFEQGKLEEARQVSKKMQFVQRILEQIDEYQFDLEDHLI